MRKTLLVTMLVVTALAFALSASALGGRSAAWKRFMSTYGYSIAYPAGWTAVRATTSMLYTSFPSENQAAVDKFLSCGDYCPKGIDVVAYARKLPAGTTLQAFTADEIAAIPSSFPCSQLKARATSTLAGESTGVLTYANRCAHLYLVENAVVHHGYGFDVYLLAPSGHESRDRATFLRILKTFHFTR